MSAGPAGRLPVSQATRLTDGQSTEHPGPRHVRDEQRIPRAEPRAQRRRQCGPRVRRRRERFGQRLAVGESVGGVARETPIDRRAERWREPGRGEHHARRRLGRLAHQQRGQIGRLERQTAAHREVADDAKRIDVAASVDRLARRLLGAHEVRGPHDLARIGRASRGLHRRARCRSRSPARGPCPPRAGCCPASRRGARCRVHARRRVPRPPRATRASRRRAEADRACGVARRASRLPRSS